MSVPQNLRSKSKLETLTRALDLNVYTRQILGNPKHFPPETDRDLLEKIRDDADNIYKYAWLANDIRVNSRASAIARDKLQAMAISACSELVIHINIAYKLFHLATKRVAFWVEKTEDVRKILKAWRNADRKKNQTDFGRFDSS